MNPRLYPSSIFFLLVAIFISTNIPTSRCADDSQYTNCSSYFSCGDITNVSYPFWGENRADYCGQRDFQLKCQENIPKIIIESITYRILNLSITAQNLTVVRDDYWETICPSEYKNNTFDSMFKYADGLQYLVLLYDCNSSFNPTNQFKNSKCNDNQNVYYASEDFSINLQGVCNGVIIPIFEAYAESVFSAGMDIQAALNYGFGLQWLVDNDQCSNCNRSGGVCGYSQTEEKFACFCKDGHQATSCSANSGLSAKLVRWLPIAIGIPIIISILVICNRKRCFEFVQKKISSMRKISHDHNVEMFMKSYGTSAPRRYSYSEVKRMTKSLTNKLGQGGYGIVYKARLSDGCLVAVKVISESKGNGEEFINEVATISRTSHVNIVSLLGFCYERNKKALIYEFMPNGSLDKFIYKGDSPNAICTLEWLKLFQIVIGIARGLEYLHRGCNTRIFHLDIKPQNILLDEDFCPKISDFGLAKICQKKESIISILGTRGTLGYIAPEVFSRTFGRVSYKSDVYSYGMLVLEMIGGRRNFDNGGSHTSEMYFPDWIYNDLEQCNILTTNMDITVEENEIVRKMTMVSLWCIQTNPLDRPSMSRVVEMLEGPIQSLPFPPKPTLYSPPMLTLQCSNVSSSTMLGTDSITIQTGGSIK